MILKSLKEAFDDFNNVISTQDNSILDIDDKAITSINPVMADAMKNFKKTAKIRNTAIDTDIKNVKTPTTPITGMKIKQAPGAKKLYLDESLFVETYNNNSDLEDSDGVVIVYDNGEIEDNFYNSEYEADAHYAELSDMTDDNLIAKNIKLIARIWRTDDEIFEVVEKRHISGAHNSDSELAQYIANLNGMTN